MMRVRLKAKPEEIAEIETKKHIKAFWDDILDGQDVNPSISEWQELILDDYAEIKDEDQYWSGTQETRIYEFVKSIAQLCRARMTTKLNKISDQISKMKKEFTE
jgi:hypothetical protein